MSKFKHIFMLKLRNKKQGFSLIELLVTISIIGILAAVAVPAYQSYIDKAKLGVSESILRQAIRNIQLNQELGDDSTSTKIAASIKSKGVAILDGSVTSPEPGALKIAGLAADAIDGGAAAILGGVGTVGVKAKVYCVSVLAKAKAYPAACAQRELGGVIKINNPSDNKICNADGTCKAT